MQATTIGKNDAKKDQKDGRVIADSEEDDRNRNPCDGADGPQDLHHRIHDLVGCRIPAERQSQRDPEDSGGAESNGHAAQRVADVAPEHILLEEAPPCLFPLRAARERSWWPSRRHAVVPEREKQRGARTAARRASPIFSVRRASSYLVRQADLLEDAVAKFQVARRADVARVRNIDVHDLPESWPGERS